MTTDATPKMLAERLKMLTSSTASKRRSFCMEESDELLSSVTTPEKRSRSCSFDSAFCSLQSIPFGPGCVSPVPSTSQASFRFPSPDTTQTVNAVLHSIPDVLKGRLPRSIPMQGLVAAMAELPQGAKHTLSTSIISWRSGRMSEGQVLAFVRSVAWQSKALRAAMGEEKSARHDEEPELLSASDFQDLLNSAPSSPSGRFSFALRPTKLGAASPPHSPGIAPLPPCLPEEGEYDEAISLVTKDEVLDSVKTQHLRTLLLRSPELQRGFLGNGWNAIAGLFEGIPDWGRALAELREHCL